MNILDLVRQDGLYFKRKGATNGGEYAGPCPFCGGTDRFVMWPLKRGKRGGSYWCRQCGKYGDAIQYLKEFHGMGFREVCNYLNVNPDQLTPLVRHEYVWTPREPGMPCEVWRKKAGVFLKEAIGALWSGNGIETRRWLQEMKGLHEDTIHTAMLGLNIKKIEKKRESWGLEPMMNEKTGKPRTIWLPAGIVIPCIHDGEVIRLRIRRFNAERGKHYIVVPGSDMRAMVFGPDSESMCIIENEIDARLLYQEAGDVTGVVAIGSAGARPDRDTDRILRKSKVILVSLDFDALDSKGKRAGATHYHKFWSRQYIQSRRWPCPIGKDPAEAFCAGLNLRIWIESALQ